MKKFAIFGQAIPCTADGHSDDRPQVSFMAYWKDGGYGSWSNSSTRWKDSGGWSNSSTNWKDSGYGHWSNSSTYWKDNSGWSNSSTSWKDSGGWSNSSGGGK